MTNPKSAKPSNRPPGAQKFSEEKFARLQAEAQAPYRGLRHFIYLAFGASGALGAFIFLLKSLAGQDLAQTLPNLAFQVGLVAAMVWLFRIDRSKSNP